MILKQREHHVDVKQSELSQNQLIDLFFAMTGAATC